MKTTKVPLREQPASAVPKDDITTVDIGGNKFTRVCTPHAVMYHVSLYESTTDADELPTEGMCCVFGGPIVHTMTAYDRARDKHRPWLGGD